MLHMSILTRNDNAKLANSTTGLGGIRKHVCRYIQKYLCIQKTQRYYGDKSVDNNYQ